MVAINYLFTVQIQFNMIYVSVVASASVPRASGEALPIFSTDGSPATLSVKDADGVATLIANGTQASKISDPSGGATVDAEARTAINDIIDAIEGFNISASV